MTLLDHYFFFCAQVCEGACPTPAGITLTREDAMERAVELQSQITDIPAFVRACAAATGAEIPQSLYDDFRPEQLAQAMEHLAAGDDALEDTPEEAQEPPRHVFEVFLESVMLEERLVAYLIDVLKRRDNLAFFKLSQVAARADIDPREFLFWLGRKEDYAEDETERACVKVWDSALGSLLREGRGEAAAAILSGDEGVFRAYCAEAGLSGGREDYERFCTLYLDRFYPLRLMLRANGVAFPDSPRG